ncbi:hypothetical protein G9A89_006903 [Geosiphon pyriformis]|nr:hypothetical protein G9A89_006903 [Geosiphon pyriformis]
MVVISGGKLLGVAAVTGVKTWIIWPWTTRSCLFSHPNSPPTILVAPKFSNLRLLGSKSYAKAAAFVVPLGAAAADMNLDLCGPPKTTPPMVPVIPSVPNSTVKSRLASLESHLNELSVLIKSLIESVGALVALVTKLLSTPTVMDVLVKKCVNGLAKQNKGLAAVVFVMQRSITHLEKRCEQAGLEDRSDVNDMVDDDNNDNKDFSVYDNIFDVIMHLWKDQPSSIKSSPDQTAKWMNSMVKNSHELVSIMGKIYELEMFDTLSSKKEQMIHSFTKRLRTDLSYALWPLLALKDNFTMDMAIELAQRIKDNQRMHLKSTLPVFAPASAMVPAPQITATSFTTYT